MLDEPSESETGRNMPSSQLLRTNDKPRLLVIGAGGHGRVVAEAAHLSQCFCDVLNVDPANSEHNGLTDENVNTLGRPEDIFFISAIGNVEARMRVFSSYSDRGYKAGNVVHPRATVSTSVNLGQGCVILANSVVSIGTKIGDGVIINTGAIIDHDCDLGSFAHVAPGAVLAGNVTLGSRSTVGANSSVRHGVHIAEDVIVGHGAVVTRSLEIPGLYLGTPARRQPN